MLETITLNQKNMEQNSTKYLEDGKVICRHQGKTVYNYTQWGRLPGWMSTKTARFLRLLNRDGLIEFIYAPQSDCSPNTTSGLLM